MNGFIPVQSQESISSSIDCSDVDINYEDDPELTRSEKLALMDKAFYDSLNKFEFCNFSSKSSSSSSSAGGVGGGSAMANDTLQGTEPKIEMPDSTSPLLNSISTGPSGGSTNGKIPEDIPPAANDDAIAAQIRLAADMENDPETREKLWNEYRKYKGMNIE